MRQLQVGTPEGFTNPESVPPLSAQARLDCAELRILSLPLRGSTILEGFLSGKTQREDLHGAKLTSVIAEGMLQAWPCARSR